LQEFIGVADQMNATERIAMPAGWNLIRTMGCNLIRKTSCCQSSKKSSRTSSTKTNWSRTTNRMKMNQTNQNSKTLASTSLTRCRSRMKTIRSYGQSCGDVTSRSCPRCGYRRHRNLHGVRRFLRHHASADYVPPVAAFGVAEFLAAPCMAALCTAVYLDIFRLDSNHCGGNSGCRMNWFAAVQP
jgi:hypothetical protein